MIKNCIVDIKSVKSTYIECLIKGKLAYSTGKRGTEYLACVMRSLYITLHRILLHFRLCQNHKF